MVTSNSIPMVADADFKSSASDRPMTARSDAASKLARELDLDDCREEVRRLQSALKQLRRENLELNRALGHSEVPEDLHVLIEDQAKRLDLMHASLSWRITAPLRLLARFLGAA